VKLHALTPMLRTWDLRGFIAFYTGVLGSECESVSGDWGWAALTRDEVGIMLAVSNQHTEETEPSFTGSLYFTTDDADGLWRRFKDKARVCYPIEDFEYGMREFGIYDNNGYLLQFGQAIPSRL
jgi:uncharacterized glyoxalase superfamily protein PhnB